MTASGRYDSSLQMFVEEVREPDLARLAFLRWLGEHELLEHRVYGPSAGECTKPRIMAQAARMPIAS